MISFSSAPTKLVALCLLLICNASAGDSDLTDLPLGQQVAIDLSPSFTDDAFAPSVNQPVLLQETNLPRFSDGLMENTKSLLQTDGEIVSCAVGSSPRIHKRLSRSQSRRLSKRQQNDFCSVQDHEKLKLAPPSPKPGASDTPVGQQDKVGNGGPQGSMGGPNEFIPDPMLDYKEIQLYGKVNPAMCPNLDKSVPVCTPYDQNLPSPAPILIPSRFCMYTPCSSYIYLSPYLAYDFLCPFVSQKVFP